MPTDFISLRLPTTTHRRSPSRNPIEARLATVTDPAARRTDRAAAAIAALITSREIPSAIAAEIVRAYQQLGSPPVAVRSSATAEDLPDASFAGQQETFLNVSGVDQLLEAVRRCWASLWTARAISYRAHHQIKPEKLSLAVVVQELIDAEASGIMFTADPVTGDDTLIEINAAWGFGEAVVGGQVTPDAITVDRASRRIMRNVINTKTIMTQLTDGATVTQPVPREQQTRRRDRVASAAAGRSGIMSRITSGPGRHRVVSQR